jgi:tight adherence protein C
VEFYNKYQKKFLFFILALFFGSLPVLAKSPEEKRAKIKESFSKCRKGDQLSCFEVGEYYERKRAYKRAIAIYKKACSQYNPKGIDKACEKLTFGEKEVFDISGLSSAKRRMSYKYIRECRNRAYSGCFNLGMLLFDAGKKNEGRKLIKRACKGEVQSACYWLKGDPSSWIIFYASIILIGIVCFIVANAFLSKEEEFKSTESIDQEKQEAFNYRSYGFIFSYSRPFFTRYVSPVVKGLKNKRKLREKYRRPLAKAGLSEVLSQEDFFSFKLFLIIAFPVIFILVREFLEESWSLSFIPVVGVIGFFYPDIWVRGHAERRRKEIIMAMPFAVDMLALSVEAGLDFIAAMAKVIEKARPSALVSEFKILQKEIKIGASRAEALRNLSWRVDLVAISSFTATLIAADSVGANIGPILKNLSEEIRQKKSAEIEKQGATAATKILFPMLFLIVPAVFIVVAAPIALELLAGG